MQRSPPSILHVHFALLSPDRISSLTSSSPHPIQMSREFMASLVWKEKLRSFFPVWALLRTILQPGVAMSRLFLQKAWYELNLEGDDIPDHSLSLLLAVGAWLWFTSAPNPPGHSDESQGPSWLLTALPCLKGVLKFFKMLHLASPHPILFLLTQREVNKENMCEPLLKTEKASCQSHTNSILQTRQLWGKKVLADNLKILPPEWPSAYPF